MDEPIANVATERCVFTGEAVTQVPFSDKLPPGRAFRQHIPLITGEGIINFFPLGKAGLPVSGKAMVAIHAFPLGCAKCGGKLLAVHSDNPDILLQFASEFLESNRKAILLAQQAGSSKLEEAPMSAKTLLIDILEKADMRLRLEGDDGRYSSITAYHVTNSGQSKPLDPRNPPLDIYHLPIEILGFLIAVRNQTFAELWKIITQRAWQLEKSGAKKKTTRKNYLYEDLFGLPHNAPLFIRRYFLRIPERRALADDPSRSYSLRVESDLVSWGITELFLKGVMCMDKERIQRIKELGSRIADYVNRENDRRFFQTLYRERNYEYFRTALIRANLKNIRSTGNTLFDLDSYLSVFEETEDMVRSDWRLARDLVLIRVIEELYHLGWIKSGTDIVPETVEEG